uniref:Uncharacterized protein n=1 Tax=Arundo donax TaxID=35708 RepID=A0A0A9C1E6_ARUDO
MIQSRKKRCGRPSNPYPLRELPDLMVLPGNSIRLAGC